MYDELIKRLRVSCEDCKLWDGYRCCLKGDCTAQTRLQAADAIEVLSKPQWIPVTERLPEKKGPYITAYSDGYVCENEWCFIGETAIGWAYDNGAITHWMPFPEPPKEET